MRFLNSEQVEAIALPLDAVAAHVVKTLVGMLSGEVPSVPRPAPIRSASGSRFMIFPALLEDRSIAGMKWLGAPGPDALAAGSRIDSLIVLNRTDTAEVLAVIDARWITAARTTAVTLVAARAMAEPSSSRIAFVACGEQARLHLDALGRHFPLRHVSCWSRRLETSAAFSEHSRALGYEARAESNIGDCVAGADIVVASVPMPPRTLFDCRTVASDCFLSLVDLGRSIDHRSIPPTCFLAVDHPEQFESLQSSAQIGDFGNALPTPLGALLAHPHASPALRGRRRILMPTGLGAADVRIALEILERAGS